MSSEESPTVEQLVADLQAGQPAARDALLARTQDRLLHLTRRMLKGFPGVRRWEETDDVWQNVALRLWKSLEAAQPTDAKHYLRLGALQIRRELIELARRYQGPLGLGAHHATQPDETSEESKAPQFEQADQSLEATKLATWTEFHEAVDKLDDETRATFDLLWYQGLSQKEAAGLLDISERTVKRRWQQARLTLHEMIGESPLGE